MSWIKEYFLTSKSTTLKPLTASALSIIPFGLLAVVSFRDGSPTAAIVVGSLWLVLLIEGKLAVLMEWLHHAGLFLTKICTFIILASFYFIVLTPFSFLWKKYFQADKLTQSTFQLEDFKRPY